MDNIELTIAKDEVISKCGRNMLLFQKAEHLLKYLVSVGEVSGFISEVDSNFSIKKEKTSSKTLGQLVGIFVENTYSEYKEKPSPSELKEIYVSSSFKIESDNAFYEARKNALAEMVADRNDLNHHLLTRINFHSIESCREIVLYLDKQHEKYLPEIETLQSVVRDHIDITKVLNQALNSDEFWIELTGQESGQLDK